MKQIIEFKKDIILKTFVNEISELNISHEYKVMDDVIEGDFYVNGEYKITEASLQNEEIFYKIPFAIALSDRIDKNSIELLIEDFNYKVNRDVLSLKIEIKMNYEEIVDIVEEIATEEINDEVNNFINEEKMDNNLAFQDEVETINKESDSEFETFEEIMNEKKEIIENITNKFNMPDKYMTYKIHIVKSEDTLENISYKYGVKIEDLKEYNQTDILNIGDKVIVPFTKIESEN